MADEKERVLSLQTSYCEDSIFNSRIKYLSYRHINIQFILYLCLFTKDYFLFFHFTRVCPLCVCLFCSLWLPWRRRIMIWWTPVSREPPLCPRPQQSSTPAGLYRRMQERIQSRHNRRQERWRQRERCQTQMCILSLRNVMSGESVKEESEQENSVWD